MLIHSYLRTRLRIQGLAIGVMLYVIFLWGSHVSAVLAESHNKSILGRFTYLFIVVQEHCVIESKPDHFLDDLRLHNPWTELKQ
jgi:hypothetical protein